MLKELRTVKFFALYKLCNATLHVQNRSFYNDRKPSSVYKMQENAWRAGLRPGPLCKSSPGTLAGGGGLAYPRSRPFGHAYPRFLIF